MTTSLPSRELRLFTEQITTLRKDVNVLLQASRSAGLGQSTINNGAIAVTGPDGEYRGSFGMMTDGTFAIIAANAPPPSRTSGPIISAIAGGLLTTWDGAFTDTERPKDFLHVEVHYGTVNNPEHSSTIYAGTLNQAGDFPLVYLNPGTTYYVWFRSVNTSLKKSDFSNATLGQPVNVVAQEILDGIVSDLKIKDGAVKEAKIAVAAVTVTKIADDAVISPKIIAGGVQAGNIATGSIAADKIVSGAITADKILANAVTADKIATNAINAGHISAGSITAAKLASTLVLTTTLIAGTSTTGNRVQIDSLGIRAYSPTEQLMFTLSSATGMISAVGSISTNIGGDRIEITNSMGYPTIFFYDAAAGLNPAYINAVLTTGNRLGLGMNSGPDASSNNTTLFLQPEVWLLQYNIGPGGGFSNNRRRGGYAEGTTGYAQLGATNDVGAGVTRASVTTSDTGFVELKSFNSAGNILKAYLDLYPNSAAVEFGTRDDANVVKSRVRADQNGNIELFTTFGGQVTTPGILKATGGFTSGGAAEMFELGGSKIYMNYGGQGLQFIQAGTNNLIKTFVIDHPNPKKTKDQWLVHAAIEGPEAAVIYRGSINVEVGINTVLLPDYFEHLTHYEGRTVHLTPMMHSGYADTQVAPSYPSDGKFTITATRRCTVSWVVMAERKDALHLEIEPRKDSAMLCGAGPYTYLQ